MIGPARLGLPGPDPDPALNLLDLKVVAKSSGFIKLQAVRFGGNGGLCRVMGKVEADAILKEFPPKSRFLKSLWNWATPKEFPLASIPGTAEAEMKKKMKFQLHRVGYDKKIPKNFYLFISWRKIPWCCTFPKCPFFRVLSWKNKIFLPIFLTII